MTQSGPRDVESVLSTRYDLTEKGQAAVAQIPAPPDPAPLVLDSSADERLAQLHALYPAAKAKAEAAAEELKAVTDAIKLALTQAATGEERRLELHGGSAGAGLPTLSLTYSTSWRVDARKLKAEDPETYVRYAKQSGSWTLKAKPAPRGQGGEQ